MYIGQVQEQTKITRYFITVSPFKHIGDRICRKTGQGQPRIIISTFVELESPMLHAKFQGHGTLGS